MMGKYEKLIQRILIAKSDRDIDFNELRNLLSRLGFTERIRGSHHVFRKDEVRDKITLQRDGHLAKAYQVKQVRRIILEYGLGDYDEQ